MSSVNLTWEADGNIDSYNIYRSTSPMNIASLPAPLATGITTKSYSDTTVAVDNLYYYRVGSIKNSIEKVSNEFVIETGDLYFNNVDLLIFADSKTLPTSTILDSSSKQRTITNNGATIQNVSGISPVFDNAILLLEPNDKMSCAISPLLTNDFTIEFFAAIPNSTSNWPRLMTIGNYADVNSETNQLNFQFSDTGRLEVYGKSGANLMTSYDTIVAQQQKNFISTTLKHACFMRKNGIFYLFVDGILQSTNSRFTTYSIDKSIINFHPVSSGSVNKYINSLRITNGVARYNTSGFIVPNRKFLSY